MTDIYILYLDYNKLNLDVSALIFPSRMCSPFLCFNMEGANLTPYEVIQVTNSLKQQQILTY